MKAHLFATFLLAASAACATVPPALKPEVNAIQIESWLWGTKTDSWLVEPNGKVSVTTVDRLFAQPLTHTTTSFTITPLISWTSQRACSLCETGCPAAFPAMVH